MGCPLFVTGEPSVARETVEGFPRFPSVPGGEARVRSASAAYHQKRRCQEPSWWLLPPPSIMPAMSPITAPMLAA